MTSDVCLQQFRAAVAMVLGWEFPSPKVVSERAKTDTFGYRKCKENLQLFTVTRGIRNSGTGLLISTASQITMLINFAKQLLPT